MAKFKKLLTILTSAAVLLSLTACSKTEETKTPEKQSLTFGMMGSIDSVPFVNCKRKRSF